MSETPHNTADAIPTPLRELLAAISEILTLPGPAATLEDLTRYESAVAERNHLVQLAIRDILSGDTQGIQWEADYLRKRAVESRPRYRTQEQWLDDLKQSIARSTAPQDGPGVTA